MENEGEWQEFQPVEREEEEDAAWTNAAPEAPKEDDLGLDWSKGFDQRWRNPFEGLAYLGYLEGEVTIPYHSFKVRTLTVGEKIKVVDLVKHLEDSIGYARAYRAAVASAALLLVDGKPLLVGKKNVDAISQRYRYITDNWYDYVIDILYDKVNELEGQVLEVLKELGVYQSRREVVLGDEVEVANPEVEG